MKPAGGQATRCKTVNASFARCAVQGRAEGGNRAGQGQEEEEEGQAEGEGASVQDSLEGAAVRPGLDLDAESSVNSLLGPGLGKTAHCYLLLNPDPSAWITCTSFCAGHGHISSGHAHGHSEAWHTKLMQSSIAANGSTCKSNTLLAF